MNIVLTGSIAYDYLMTFPGYFKDHILVDRLDSISLSFLVDSMTKLRGGIAPNIAYTMALLGSQPRIMATVGEDFEEYRNWLESHGIDTSEIKVIPGEFTASFFANTDLNNAQIASFYPGAMAYASQLSFRTLRGYTPDLAVISPNDPMAMKQYAVECRQLGIDYFYDPSQQTARFDGDELRHGIDGAKALFCNDYEFGLIQKKANLSATDLLEMVGFMVVTRGEHGSTIYLDSEQISIPVVLPQKIVDPTGVGDAFRGGFLAGYSNQLDLEVCGKMGAVAAAYCLEQKGTQNHTYSKLEFLQRYRSNFDDADKLEAFLLNEVATSSQP